MNKHWTSKYLQMTDFRLLSSELLFGCHISKCTVRDPILNIYCGSGCFRPKIHGQVLVMKHGFHCFYDRPILSFSHSILLGIIGGSQLPLNPCFSAKTVKVFGGKLPSIIRSQGLDLSFGKILHKSFELTELSKYFIFTFQKINPGFAREIINKRDIVIIPAK